MAGTTMAGHIHTIIIRLLMKLDVVLKNVGCTVTKMLDHNTLSKAGNAYLRYYLIEATSHVKNHCGEFAAFYQKKYDEVKIHQHKRALALTARKFVRLIFGLLANHQLYSSDRVVQA